MLLTTWRQGSITLTKVTHKNVKQVQNLKWFSKLHEFEALATTYIEGERDKEDGKTKNDKQQRQQFFWLIWLDLKHEIHGAGFSPENSCMVYQFGCCLLSFVALCFDFTLPDILWVIYNNIRMGEKQTPVDIYAIALGITY